MTSPLLETQRRSGVIAAEIACAVDLLEAPRRNGLDIHSHPHALLTALQSAREAIDRALAGHAGTTWPTAADYDVA